MLAPSTAFDQGMSLVFVAAHSQPCNHIMVSTYCLCLCAQANLSQHCQGAEKQLAAIGNLARLQKLVKLMISHSGGLQECNPQSFAELTTNSNLDTLIVDFVRGAAMPLTATASTAWEHTFPPGRQLLQVLLKLSLGCHGSLRAG
jgi:hypothetical protein